MRFSIQSIFFYLGTQSPLTRYGLAVLVVIVTTLATISIRVIGERAAFLLFFFGIIQVSFWLGLYPAILAAALSLASVNLLVLLPAAINVGDMVVLNAGFCFVSVIMVLTTGFHRQLAMALWQSRQDLANAQTLGQIGSWRLNVARNELHWSDENHRIFGVAKNTPMTYEKFLSIVHPDDRDYVDRRWQAGLRGAPYDIEHRLIVSGKVKWVREKAVLEFDSGRNLLGGFGITQDITRRIELQDQLAKVAASVPGLICSFRLRPDGSACMPFASPVIDSIYGISLDVVSDDFNPVFARIHPDDLERIRQSIAESARTLQPWRDTYRYNHPTRGEMWHEGHSMPMREADGCILWHGYVHDVTERIRAEQNLQERIDRYELVLNGAQDAIWDWDVLNRTVHYSSRWKALRGYDEDEIGNCEEEWSANIHPDDAERVFMAIHKHFQGHTTVFCEEYRIRCKDGSWKWILDRGIARKNRDGTVTRMAGSENDITERKLAENALRDQEAQLRLIMDATPAVISYLDLDFRYVRVNATYEKWFGIPTEHIVGRKVEEIIGSAAWQIVSAYLLRARNGEIVSFDQKIPYGANLPRWVHATYLPNINANGEVEGIVVHVFDIEDRVESEQEIIDLNHRLQRRMHEMQVIFNTVPIGLCIAGSVDSVDGESMRGNASLERMLGLSAHSELSLRHNPDVCARVKHDNVELAIDDMPMQRANRGEVITNQLLEITRSDQKVITVLCNASPILSEQGEAVGAVGAFLDLTDYVKQKQLTGQREKIAQSFRYYVALQTVAAIAHELNQPLAAISSYADFALHALRTGNPDLVKLTQVLENCAAQTQRAGDVIRQLLAQLQNEESPNEHIDINAAVCDALDLLEPNTAISAYQVETDLTPDLPQVSAQSLQIQKVLINLLRNGLESMLERGSGADKIVIRTRRSALDPSMVQVTVEDSGKGVSDSADLRKIFLPFFSTKPKGLGMGLAVSRSLIAAYGGKMWAEKNNNLGLSIHFTLPIAE